MTTLLDSTQLATIAGAISALINNGNAPVNTANALEALRDGILAAESAVSGGGDLSDLEDAMADMESAIGTVQNSIAGLQDVDAATQGWIDSVNVWVSGFNNDLATLTASIAAEHSTNVTQGAAISTATSKNTTQDSAITAIQGVNTTQDTAIAAIQATDTAQDAAIAALSASLLQNAPAAPTRTLGTAYQISTTRPADIVANLPITSSATLVLGSRGRLTVRYADNSGMSTNVVTLPLDEFGIGSGLVVTGYGILKVMGRIPAGKWVQIDKTDVTGTPTYGSLGVQETVL